MQGKHYRVLWICAKPLRLVPVIANKLGFTRQSVYFWGHPDCKLSARTAKSHLLKISRVQGHELSSVATFASKAFDEIECKSNHFKGGEWHQE
jgi:hypothetical protein